MKPCIECGKECEILPVQLGDLFTLAYLRVCSGECMFLIAYEYLREVGYNKAFRGSLYDRQDAEDKALRDQYVKEVTDESLCAMREHFEACPDLLSRPIPNLIHEMFKSEPTINQCSTTMRFTRPCLEDRIKWQNKNIERLKKQLDEEIKSLNKLLEEKK